MHISALSCTDIITIKCTRAAYMTDFGRVITTELSFQQHCNQSGLEIIMGWNREMEQTPFHLRDHRGGVNAVLSYVK